MESWSRQRDLTGSDKEVEMFARLTLTVVATLWLMAGSQAAAQPVGPVASEGRLAALAGEVVARSLGDATHAEVRRRAAAANLYQPPATGSAPTRRALKWGIGIGAVAGIVGGALQPTHSNGEYVLGGGHLSSTLALGGIGAGIGALIGLAIDR
jgi:hypothetical protein